MKKFYIIGILLMVMLVFTACGQKQTIDQVIEGFTTKVTTWEQDTEISEEDIIAIQSDIDAMKTKAIEAGIEEAHAAKINELITKLEALVQVPEVPAEEVMDAEMPITEELGAEETAEVPATPAVN